MLRLKATMRFTAAPFEKPFFAPLRLCVRFMGSFSQKQRVRWLLAPFTLGCLLLICTFGVYAQSPASSQNTPQATLTSFYRSYLDAFAKTRHHLLDYRRMM